MKAPTFFGDLYNWFYWTAKQIACVFSGHKLYKVSTTTEDGRDSDGALCEKCSSVWELNEYE